jgi:hypothetical protein
MKIRLIKIYFLLLVGGNLFAQDLKPVISLPDFNVLYRGFLNKVEFGNINEIENLKILTENVKIDTVEVQQYIGENLVKVNLYYLLPGREPVASIIFMDSMTQKILSTRTFRVLNIPSPRIHLGKFEGEGEFPMSILEGIKTIECKHPIDFPMQVNYEVIAYEFRFAEDGKEICSGTSGFLSPFAIETLTSLKAGSKVVLLVKYSGSGSNGFSTTVFEVIDM